MNDKRFTITGTNINDVKRKNASSGLTYNQVKQLLAEKYMKEREK
ncbi:hypothetical protein ACFVR2_22415 [Gottfriedia sp. NPDC057991]